MQLHMFCSNREQGSWQCFGRKLLIQYWLYKNMWTTNMWHLLELKAWFQPDVPVSVLSKTVSGHRYFWTLLYQLLTSGHGTQFQMCLGLDYAFPKCEIHLLLQLLLVCLESLPNFDSNSGSNWLSFSSEWIVPSKISSCLGPKICVNVLPHYILLCILLFCFPPGGLMNILRYATEDSLFNFL